MASNFNDVTGATIITKTTNQDIFERNFEAIQNGSALLEAEKKKNLTMFPITFSIPQSVYKDLESLGKSFNSSVNLMAQRIFLENMRLLTVNNDDDMPLF